MPGARITSEPDFVATARCGKACRMLVHPASTLLLHPRAGLTFLQAHVRSRVDAQVAAENPAHLSQPLQVPRREPEILHRPKKQAGAGGDVHGGGHDGEPTAEVNLLK